MYSVIISIGNIFYLTYAALTTILTPLIAGNINQPAGQSQLQSVINSINLKQLLIGGVLLIVFLYLQNLS